MDARKLLGPREFALSVPEVKSETSSSRICCNEVELPIAVPVSNFHPTRAYACRVGMVGRKPTSPVAYEDIYFPLGRGWNDDVKNTIPVEISQGDGMGNEPCRLMVRTRGWR